MRVRFRPLTVAQLRKAGDPLFSAHYEEGSTYRGEVPLKINWDQYDRLERAGLVTPVGAFDGAQLVGYSALAKVPNLLYSDIVSAHAQIVYLMPKYRSGTNGVRFFRYLEALARAMGCNEFHWSVSRGRKRELRLAVALGYKAREMTFTRVL